MTIMLVTVFTLILITEFIDIWFCDTSCEVIS